jgi:hypothetical protein
MGARPLQLEATALSSPDRSGYSASAPRVSSIEETQASASRASADRLASSRWLDDQRLRATVLISFVVATTAISLYDMYLLVSLLGS